MTHQPDAPKELTPLAKELLEATSIAQAFMLVRCGPYENLNDYQRGKWDRLSALSKLACDNGAWPQGRQGPQNATKWAEVAKANEAYDDALCKGLASTASAMQEVHDPEPQSREDSEASEAAIDAGLPTRGAAVPDRDIRDMGSQEADETGVARFSTAMRDKLALKRSQGKHGWNWTHAKGWGCTVRELEAMLKDHLAKGDVVDVANFCMMIWNRRNPK